jgi:hypothetical protein
MRSKVISRSPCLVLLTHCCAVLAWPAGAAVSEAWIQRYNVSSNASDVAAQVIYDAAGDIIVTGSNRDDSTRSDMLTIKYSGTDGTVIWRKRYNGPANGDDVGEAVAVDASGNVVVTGSSEWDTDSGGWVRLTQYYTAKYAAADGALLWEKRSRPSGSDAAHAVAVDGGGNVVVTGVTCCEYNSYTAKYAAADGVLLWEQSSKGGGQAIAVDAGGNVIMTGPSEYEGSSGSVYYTVKYAGANGALLWEQSYNDPLTIYNKAHALAIDGNGNAVVTGSSYKGTSHDFYTVKYAAADGVLLWDNRYDGPNNSEDRPYAMAIDGDGNVLVTGSSQNGTNYDYYTTKYGVTDGAMLWEHHYNGPADRDDVPHAIALDGNGNVVVTGSSHNGSDNDHYTAKYAVANGALLWERRFNGPGSGNDSGEAIAVNGSGDVAVAGFSSNGAPGFDYDYYTAKYAEADGALLWERRYNSPGNSFDHADAVLVDGSANVVVMGSGATVKYAANGALLWEKHSTNGVSSAMALDGSGNVVVTGSSSSQTNHDYYTAKYAAADGALLWEKSYNGPADHHDEPQAVAVDVSGNVVVTGGSTTGYDLIGRSLHDGYTAKYAAEDGTLLWERRFNGLSNGDDFAIAVVVDDSGNVVVSGGSATGLDRLGYRIYDYYLAKYAAKDGSLLWEKWHDGPATYGFATQAIAVDEIGNVAVTGAYYYTNSYIARYAAADGALIWERHGPAGVQALAVDGSGNVVVTGSPWRGFLEGYDYYTAKYAAADGALVWERCYNGPSSGDEFARAVAVDGNGNVVVTGDSKKDGGYQDNEYYTAKYAAADGALLWEKHYTGRDNDAGLEPSLAVGPHGMVAITGSSSGDYTTLVYQENLFPISIDRVTNGVRLRFTGAAGSTYNMERAPTLMGPWSTIALPIAPIGGTIEYIDLDTNPPTGSAFYRTSTPTP